MNVMKKAWEIAKQGQQKFGGNAKEYFSEALKLAWKDVKFAPSARVQNVNLWENYGKSRVYVNLLVDWKEERIGTLGKCVVDCTKKFEGYYDNQTGAVVVTLNNIKGKGLENIVEFAKSELKAAAAEKVSSSAKSNVEIKFTSKQDEIEYFEEMYDQDPCLF